MSAVRFACALTALVALGHPAAAQVALYGAQPPAAAAFIRFVNATPGPVDVRPEFLPDQHLGTAPSERVGAYAVVNNVATRPLGISAREGNQLTRTTLRISAGSYVTVIVAPTAAGSLVATPVVEQADFNQARARLVFYNATPGCPAADLTLQPAGTAVFSGVAPAAASSRTVTPVQAQIRASCGGVAAPGLALDGLEAGASFSIWLMRPADQLISFVTRDTTMPYKP